MSNPIVADNKPKKVELEKGKEYYFCRCGCSKDQPFCDGSHKGTDFTPKSFVADDSGDAFLCQCKHTNDAPFCDGTQKKELRQRLNIDKSASQLKNFFEASVSLMEVMARACGHDHLNQFTIDDLATWNREMALLAGVQYSGYTEPS